MNHLGDAAAQRKAGKGAAFNQPTAPRMYESLMKVCALEHTHTHTHTYINPRTRKKCSSVLLISLWTNMGKRKEKRKREGKNR